MMSKMLDTGEENVEYFVLEKDVDVLVLASFLKKVSQPQPPPKSC